MTSENLTATKHVLKNGAPQFGHSACEAAQNLYQNNFKDSDIPDLTDDFPKFTLEAIKKGKVLGKGGFGTVFEIRGFMVEDDISSDPAASQDDSDHGNGTESRKFISDHCIRKGGDARYAIKTLSPEVVKDPDLFYPAMSDMATETRIMSFVVHPNIVKIRAIAKGSWFCEDYFIVMDRLYDTLKKRLVTWAKNSRVYDGVSGKLVDRKGKKKAKLYEERVVAAFDLSAALAYLHKNQIMHRDLKPENIGFDIRGDIKIFDFGLAKEIPLEGAFDNGLFQFTEMCGSPRYMAPEVALGKPYNKSCDVYSFALLLWEMLALERPFELFDMSSFREKVWGEMRERPHVKDSWSVPMKLLLKRAWTADVQERHKMANIERILRKECVACRDGNDSGLEHERRRSTFVFRNAKIPIDDDVLMGESNATNMTL